MGVAAAFTLAVRFCGLLLRPLGLYVLCERSKAVAMLGLAYSSAMLSVSLKASSKSSAMPRGTGVPFQHVSTEHALGTGADFNPQHVYHFLVLVSRRL